MKCPTRLGYRYLHEWQTTVSIYEVFYNDIPASDKVECLAKVVIGES